MYSFGSDMSEYVVTEQSFARAAIVHTPLMEDSLMNRATRILEKHLLCYHYTNHSSFSWMSWIHFLLVQVNRDNFT